MSTNDRELSQILVDCQAKLLEIDDKLSHIKNRCRNGRTKHKYSLHTNEDFIILKKETESLESDIQFVRTLLEESVDIHSSFPLRMMKKVLPLKMFSSQNKPISNEIKAKILAHSTALLEEKVNVLQTIAVSKKKKRRPKRESRDSVATDTTNSIKANALLYKPRASSDSEIFMNTEKMPSLKVLSSLKKSYNPPSLINNSSIETELKFWNSGLSKYLTPPTKTIVANSVKKTRSQTEYNFTTFSEQHVQTVEVNSHLTIDTNEKYVQTDFPLVTWVTAVMNQNKLSKQYIEKETNTDKEITVNDSSSSSNNLRNMTDSQNQEVISSLANILDINEIDNIINSLLYSPLKMLQCKHMNKLAGGKVGNPHGYVNLIIRQSDFLPLVVSGIEDRTIKSCKQFYPADCICFPYIYQVRLNMSWPTVKYNGSNKSLITDEKGSSDISTEDYRNIAGKTEFSFRYENTEINNKCRVSNTLQIDYKNPQTSGRIIITEFGDSQSSAQSEMITKILTQLIGLPNSKVDCK